MKTLEYSDFERIVLEETPLIDVRAPVEFEKGAFKNATNLPLMNNRERHLVGICYKEQGNAKAVELGHELVSGKVKESRVNAWINHLRSHPNSVLYCFRGGLRSQIAQQWITEQTGGPIWRLAGGYKAFRNYLITQLDPAVVDSTPILLSGCTGSGKTILLKKLPHAIDLEGIANHRGSAFGRKLTPQPSQIDFENNLAYALIHHRHHGYKHLILEDEGTNIGRCFLPKPLATYFNSGKVVLIEVSLSERIKNTLDEYVSQAQGVYSAIYGPEYGLAEWANNIRNSLNRIKKRLGGDRHERLLDLFEHGYHAQLQSDTLVEHEKWITALLEDYYDPMYHYQLERKADRILFRGNAEEVLDYLNKYTLTVK